jgi:hypothetical protein
MDDPFESRKNVNLANLNSIELSALSEPVRLSSYLERCELVVPVGLSAHSGNTYRVLVAKDGVLA